ncbi:hypothetical protein P3W45_001865, partial [Vairimorpha bombi]
GANDPAFLRDIFQRKFAIHDGLFAGTINGKLRLKKRKLERTGRLYYLVIFRSLSHNLLPRQEYEHRSKRVKQKCISSRPLSRRFTIRPPNLNGFGTMFKALISSFSDPIRDDFAATLVKNSSKENERLRCRENGTKKIKEKAPKDAYIDRIHVIDANRPRPIRLKLPYGILETILECKSYRAFDELLLNICVNFLLGDKFALDKKPTPSGEGLFAKVNRHQGACFWAKPGKRNCRFAFDPVVSWKRENGTGTGIENDIKEEDL